MRRNRAARLQVENLDERVCPSVSAGVANGILTITGQGASQLAVTELPKAQFQVVNNGNLVGDYSGVTKGVAITMDSHSDAVSINLGGDTLPGYLNITLGQSQNSLKLFNGTVSGALNLTGGISTDTFVLGGDGSATPKTFPALNVGGGATINSGLGGADSLTLEPGVTFKGNLSVLSANTFTMDAGSVVAGNASIYGGYAANTVTVAGNVEQQLKVVLANSANSLSVAKSATIGSLVANMGDGHDTTDLEGTIAGALNVTTGAGTDTLTLAGQVGGEATLNLGSGSNSLTFSGTVGGGGNCVAMDVEGGSGKDVVNFAMGSFVDGSAKLNLGARADSATLAGTIGASGSKSTLTLNTGAGADSATFASSLVINGNAAVDLGAGNDVFTLQSGATFTSAVIDGGPGTDTFVGNASLVKAENFEVFVNIAKTSA